MYWHSSIRLYSENLAGLLNLTILVYLWSLSSVNTGPWQLSSEDTGPLFNMPDHSSYPQPRCLLTIYAVHMWSTKIPIQLDG